MSNYGIDRNGKVYRFNPDKLKDWAKMFNCELDFDHIGPWIVKDPGLGYKEFHGCIDALRYSTEFLCKYEGKWKGEQKMGITRTECCGGAAVNGSLYYRDDDGNFVKLMTVTNIEETATFDSIESEIKDQTWHDLECTFMYDVGAVLNAIFSAVSIKSAISRMLRTARRVVKYNAPEELDDMKTVLNSMYGRASAYSHTDLPVAANIEKVIFDAPATVILWKDGTRTVVHAQGEHYDKEKGFAMAVCKKIFGNERDYYHVFKRWFRKGEDRTAKEMERRRNEL